MNCIDPPQGVPFTGLLVVERELKLEGGVHHLVADPHVAYLNPIVERYHEEVRVTVIVVLPRFASPRELNRRCRTCDGTVRLDASVPVTHPPIPSVVVVFVVVVVAPREEGEGRV